MDLALSQCREQAKSPEACGVRLTFCAEGKSQAMTSIAGIAAHGHFPRRSSLAHPMAADLDRRRGRRR